MRVSYSGGIRDTDPVDFNPSSALCSTWHAYDISEIGGRYFLNFSGVRFAVTALNGGQIRAMTSRMIPRIRQRPTWGTSTQKELSRIFGLTTALRISTLSQTETWKLTGIARLPSARLRLLFPVADRVFDNKLYVLVLASSIELIPTSDETVGVQRWRKNNLR